MKLLSSVDSGHDMASLHGDISHGDLLYNFLTLSVQLSEFCVNHLHIIFFSCVLLLCPIASTCCGRSTAR